MASPGGNPPDAGPLKGGKPDPKSEKGPPEPGCGKGFPEAGWGFGGGGCGIGDGYTYGDGLDRKKGDGYGETAATVAQRYGETFRCIALAGPQPNGVAANRAMPMIATVMTVMVAAATMRWSRGLNLIRTLRKLMYIPRKAMLEKGARVWISYGGAASICDTSAWAAGSKRLSSTAFRAAESASSRRPSWRSTRARFM